MKLAEYVAFDGIGLAQLVRSGEVEPLELVEVAFAALEKVNPRLNAVIATYREQAEQSSSGPLPDGPFKGVPFLLKDLGLFVAGQPTTMGSRLFAGGAAPFDSELVVRYRKAGLILIGRTNVPEFGTNFTTESVLFGPCRNPWNPDRSPGGSSGGAAAAVAARVVPVAHANDGAGSIRVPAGWCGLFGLKPTRGRTPVGPYMDEILSGLAVNHAVTRSVRDSAALLDATAGTDIGAPYSAPEPQGPFLAEVGRTPGRLRIAFSEQAPNGAPVGEDCKLALRRAVQLCTELGHELVEAAPTYNQEELRTALYGMVAVNLGFALYTVAPMFGLTPSSESVEGVMLALGERSRGMSALDLLRFRNVKNQVSRGVGQFFTKFDVLLTPTVAQPPIPLGTLDANEPGLDPYEYMDRTFGVAPFGPLANITGQPSMTVPLHQSGEGLPIGVQFTGRFGDEATLFRLAGQLEQAAPWGDRRPPVCA